MAPNPDALRVITQILGADHAEKASADNTAERISSLIGQMYGAAHKATPVNPTIKAVAEKHGVVPVALVDALRELAKGEPATKAQAQTIADVVAAQQKAEPTRAGINDPVTAKSLAADVERVNQTADRVIEESQRTPIGDAIRNQLRNH